MFRFTWMLMVAGVLTACGCERNESSVELLGGGVSATHRWAALTPASRSRWR